MTSRFQRALRAALTLLMLSTLACDLSDPCDPGDYEEHGACRPIPQDAPLVSDASMGDSGEDGGSEADAEPPSDPYEGFGDACADVGDCRDGLICGAPMLPICTQVNCLDEPSICPPDWTCFDTTGLSPDPNVTSICLQ
jgi:hypothetical protein